jgi:hypothetical protein
MITQAVIPLSSSYCCATAVAALRAAAVSQELKQNAINIIYKRHFFIRYQYLS